MPTPENPQALSTPASPKATPLRTEWSGGRSSRRRRRGGNRTLHYWLLRQIGVPIGYAIVRLLRLTWTVSAQHLEHRLQPGIFAMWHGDLVMGSVEMHSLMPNVDVLTSPSRDGQLAARFTQLHGAKTIAGSSSKGGASALLWLRRSLRRRRSIVIPVDGPRGPRGEVKPGIILVASQTGAPIVPGAIRPSSAWKMNSWDELALPKPFARLELEYGQPLYIVPNATREELEQGRLELEKRLWALHRMEPHRRLKRGEKDAPLARSIPRPESQRRSDDAAEGDAPARPAFSDTPFPRENTPPAS